MSSLIQQLAPILERETWLLALDRDGTLVPIVDDPAEAVIQDSARTTVLALAEEPGVHVALVSARGLAGLREDLDPGRVILAGSYGLEISFANGQKFIEPTASRAVPRIRELRQALSNLLAEETRVIVEDHTVSLCIHWHNVSEDQRPLVHAAVAKLQPAYPDLYFKLMPTSYEIQPEVSWDKGCALAEIEKTLALESEKTAYVYAGDFHTDEPAFRWVNSRGGASIKVGVSGSTAARSHLATPAHLWHLLEELVIFRRSHNAAQARRS